MAFRSVHSLLRWSFIFCTSLATSISCSLGILNAMFVSSDFISRLHAALSRWTCTRDLFGRQLQRR
jgi:hypothetical protein